jgi:hypothetical protein
MSKARLCVGRFVRFTVHAVHKSGIRQYERTVLEPAMATRARPSNPVRREAYRLQCSTVSTTPYYYSLPTTRRDGRNGAGHDLELQITDKRVDGVHYCCPEPVVSPCVGDGGGYGVQAHQNMAAGSEP